MAKAIPKPPTDAELEILGVLWEHGPSTVRQVHDLLEPTRRGLHHRVKADANHV